MGRILYDEVDTFELMSRDRLPSGRNVTPLDILKERWGESTELYASTHDDMRDCLICWYHNNSKKELVASKETAEDMGSHGMGVGLVRILGSRKRN